MASELQEIRISNFKGGVTRLTQLPEMDRSVNNSVYDAINVELDEEGNVYTCHGYDYFGGSGLQASFGLFYCFAIDKLILAVAGGLHVYNADTGALIHSHNSIFTSSDKKCYFAPWPMTDVCYVSNTEQWGKLNLAGTTWTDLSITAPRGCGKIRAHRNHMISAENATAGRCKVSISAINLPESFSGTDDLTCEELGPSINGFSALNGILHIHKIKGIYLVGGDLLSGNGKDVWKVPLNTGAGALHNNGIAETEQLVFYFGFNGMYAFNGKESTPILARIRQKLNQVYIRKGVNNFEITDADFLWMVVYSPTWGAESGRHFIIFALKTATMYDGIVFKYEPSSDTMVELNFGEQNFVVAAAYAPEKNTTFLINNRYGEIVKMGPSKVWGSNITNIEIESEVTTHLISTEEVEEQQKNFQQVAFERPWANDIVVNVGYEGVAPSLTLQDTLTDVYSLPNLGSYGMQLRVSRNQGGQPLLAGMKVGLTLEETTPHRNWMESRRAAAEYMMVEGPLIKGGAFTCVGGETSITVAHGLSRKPKIVLAVLNNQFFDKYFLAGSYSTTNFTVTLPSGVTPSAGDKLYWVAISESCHIYDSGFVLAKMAMSELATYHYQTHPFSHYLSQIVEAGTCFVNKQANANKQILTSADDFKLGAQARAGGVVGDLAELAYIYYSSDDTYFRVGNGVVNSSSVAVTHGLGVTPDAVVIQYDNNTDIAQGANFKLKLGTVGATTFSVHRDGSNDLNFRWIAIKNA